MSKEFLFIVNPTAGQGAAKLAVPEIEHLSKEYCLEYDLEITEYPGHGIELAKQAAWSGYSYVIAVGGDGTSNEVLNGLMQALNQGDKASTLGILAIGRGNDFAFGLGIPPGLEPGFRILNERKLQPMDVGLVVGGDYPAGRYFGNGVGIGFDAVVGFEAAKLSHLHGFINYVVAALKTIFLYFHAPTLKINYNDQHLTQPSLMVSIMNGRRMGGGFMMAPDAETNDGYLNLCIAGQVSRLGILKLIPKFMKGTQAEHPKITTGKATSIQVTALEGTLPVHADGETICVAGKQLSIELLKTPIMILSD